MTLRVRFAPSPTGYLHVGGARTALFNWLLARKEKGVFVLRIEDTDRERSSDEHTAAILEGMRWLGLDWDEGPVFQSEGLTRHQGDARRLLREGKAYRDFSTPEEIREDRARAEREGTRGGLTRAVRARAEALGVQEGERRAEAGEEHAVRFRVPEGETVWEDWVHGTQSRENRDIDDLVILRSDGTPTYNFAVVSDDAEMNITHVVRGDDHLSNTPKQIVLYKALGHPVPIFGHVPLILGSDGKRLSKRHGATAVAHYENDGILPAAMVNFLALLGWSPGEDREIMTLEEMIEWFSMERVNRNSAVFDVDKLRWLNGEYVSATPAEALEERVVSDLRSAGLVDAAFPGVRREWFLDLLNLLKTRAKYTVEIAQMAIPYVVDEIDLDPDAVRKHWSKDPQSVREILGALVGLFEETDWTAEAIEERLRGLAAERGVGAGKVIHPVRVAVTGQESSPGIFDVLVFVGKDRTLERLRRALETLDSLGAS